MANQDTLDRVWLNVQIPRTSKEILGHMSFDLDMSMSAICRRAIQKEIEAYEQAKTANHN